MKRIVPSIALALASLATPAAAAQDASPPSATPAKPLTMEQQTALRCSVAFALAAEAQAKGEAWAAGYPPLAERGREFFVRTSARIMDETGMAREAVSTLLAGEVPALREDGALAQTMPPCLLLLDASGL